MKTTLTTLLLFLVVLVSGQTLNRSTISFFGEGSVASETEVSGSAYSVANFAGSNLLISGFQQPDSLNFTVQINELEELSIQVYPNPFQGSFNVNSNGLSGLQLNVFNLLGELVLTKSDFNGGVVNLSNLDTGTYIIYLIHGSKSKVIKLIHE